jgi:hypothetical protein
LLQGNHLAQKCWIIALLLIANDYERNHKELELEMEKSMSLAIKSLCKDQPGLGLAARG